MLVWHRGVKATSQAISEKVMGIDEFFTKVREKNIPRVPGSAVFLTRTQNDIPPVMRWHVARNRALQQKVLSLTINILNVPRVDPAERLVITEQAADYWRGVAQYGFMERPHIPELLQSIVGMNCQFQLDDVTYYLGHETIVGREDGYGLASWQRSSFAFMVRNCTHVTNYYHLPSDQVVEISRRVAI
ncbi:KUP/HAK/KT family potassium transporter [Yersinia alsatica]|uniref:KUP/HAK/KT family potassium transporter n=1 Tax=Yersinia alsatica TaxID=2890317 RepID=UPI003D9A88B5